MKEPTPRGEIVRRYGSTSVGTLRRIYGGAFAYGEADDVTLADVLRRLDVYSLAQLLRHVKRGELKKLIMAAERDDLG